MTGLLLDTDLDDDQREFATTARRSGEALLEQVVGVFVDSASLDIAPAAAPWLPATRPRPELPGV